MSQARIKPEVFVNFRPEPDPKSPNPTQKARPDLQLCVEDTMPSADVTSLQFTTIAPHQGR